MILSYTKINSIVTPVNIGTGNGLYSGTMDEVRLRDDTLAQSDLFLATRNRIYSSRDLRLFSLSSRRYIDDYEVAENTIRRCVCSNQGTR
jgi:hypothetical protein